MEFGARPDRRSRESIVPMINVVFLLLVFFLMAAQIRPPDPFGVSEPAAEAAARAEGQMTLHVSATGEVAFGEARGPAALAALAAEADARPVLIRADAALDGNRFARLLAELAAAGVTDARLVTRP